METKPIQEISKLVAFRENEYTIYRILLKGAEYCFNIIDELQFTQETVEDELRIHSEKAALLTSFYEESKLIFEKAEKRYEIEYAKKWLHFKELGDKTTDKKADMLTESDETISELYFNLIDCRGVMNKLKALVNLFNSRKDLMQTFCANMRKIV